jgi:hypothetical protein
LTGRSNDEWVARSVKGCIAAATLTAPSRAVNIKAILSVSSDTFVSCSCAVLFGIEAAGQVVSKKVVLLRRSRSRLQTDRPDTLRGSCLTPRHAANFKFHKQISALSFT